MGHHVTLAPNALPKAVLNRLAPKPLLPCFCCDKAAVLLLVACARL